MNGGEQYSTVMQWCGTGLNSYCSVLLQNETAGRVTCAFEQDKGYNIES